MINAMNNKILERLRILELTSATKEFILSVLTELTG